jgi:hypothetical protein
LKSSIGAFAATEARLENAAVTVLAASIVTTQAAVPVQAPDQPAKVEVASGVAIKVTDVPLM